MEKLSPNWITEGWNDFEYKKYLLLAYLQHVNSRFTEVKLYPEMAELVDHYRKLKTLMESREKLRNAFPKRLDSVDLKKFQIKYEETAADDEVMEEVIRIMQFAEPKLKDAIEEGKEIFDWIEDQIKVESVGVLPMYKKEGYLFLWPGSKGSVQVFRYAHSLVSWAGEQYRSLQTWFIQDEVWGLSRSLVQMKRDLIKNTTELPNPAVFLVRTKDEFPLNESLLPITKRLLVRDYLI